MPTCGYRLIFLDLYSTLLFIELRVSVISTILIVRVLYTVFSTYSMYDTYGHVQAERNARNASHDVTYLLVLVICVY